MNRRNFLSFIGTGTWVSISHLNGTSGSFSKLKIRKSGALDPWIEVNLDHLSWNVNQIRKLVKVPIMAVIKANAYGHGLFEIAHFLEKQKVDGLMVGKLEEAIELKEKGIKCPILNFGPFSKEDCEEIVKGDFSQTVYTDDVIFLNEKASRANKKVGVHIHIDTGLGRTGIPYYKALPFIEKVASLSHLKIQGISTDLSEDNDFDREQLRRFREVCLLSEKKGISLGWKHVASSDGIINLKESHLDMVRPGITLYGYYPSPHTQKEDILKLQPVLSLKAKVLYVKDLYPGDTLSYHRTFLAKKKELVATLGIGYSDGYPFQLANKGEVLIKNKKYPVIATVTANHMMINLENDAQIKAGDEVILIDHQKESPLTADKLAERSGLSVYKILIGLSPLLPRKYLKRD